MKLETIFKIRIHAYKMACTQTRNIADHYGSCQHLFTLPTCVRLVSLETYGCETEKNTLADYAEFSAVNVMSTRCCESFSFATSLLGKSWAVLFAFTASVLQQMYVLFRTTISVG